MMDTLKQRFGLEIHTLRVDGGVAKSDFVLQSFADILGCRIERPANTDRTPMGAVYLAGLASGLWRDKKQIRSLWVLEPSSRILTRRRGRNCLQAGGKRSSGRSTGSDRRGGSS